MRAYLSYVMVVIVCGGLFGQELTQMTQDSLVRENEIKVNGLILIFGAFEVNYERFLNEESSVGVSLLIPFVDSDDVNWNINYYISPYYRVFFGKAYASGFFVEGFGMLNSKERERYSGNEFLGIEDVTDFGLGLGLGAKWVTSKGFVFELNGGLSRNLFNNKDYSGGEVTGKIGFNVGYRF